MPRISLPGGDLEYTTAGPESSSAPPVLFVHGFLVNSTLWSSVATLLADAGVRSYLPDLPLGAHSVPLDVDAEQSPRGVAKRILAFIEVLGLRDVTLVGNDTGGAICQFLVDTDASRIGRLVLTNCDAFQRFPPPQFKMIFWIAKSPARIAAALAPMRLKFLRHSPLGFGLLLKRPRDGELTMGWLRPALAFIEVRRDAAVFARAVRPEELDDVGSRLHRFGKPVRMVWGADDRCFRLSDAGRLAVAFGGDASVIEVPNATTFVSIDQPEAVTRTIIELGS